MQTALFFGLLFLASCACGRDGDPGAPCEVHDDCESGFCCGSDHCGGGMCTYPCHDDRDCPPDMGCEHETCFFRCDGDRDCAPGETCEHGDTVCELGGH
jgi:hypothetical protein